MNWILSIALLALAAYTVAIYRSRNQYRESAKTLARELAEWRRSRTEQLKMENWKPVPLTQPKPKAQDVPKRLSGSQLRRMAERVNVETMASLQERPNSEILQEQETNG